MCVCVCVRAHVCMWHITEYAHTLQPRAQDDTSDTRQRENFPHRARRRDAERRETLRKESEMRKRNNSVRNTQEGTRNQK